MKIVEPSATILEPELAGLSVCQRIDRCASVCYQRDPRPTEEYAREFCQRLINRGHLPALEFAVLHVAMDRWVAVDFETEKYLMVHHYGYGEDSVITGSVRAFMEIGNKFDMAHLVEIFLARTLPVFFKPSPPVNPPDDIRFAAPHEIPWEHKHVAVRFVVNRAVSHELVRHRPCSFLQESQRYCRYDEGVTFIRPGWIIPRKHEDWFSLQCSISESAYLSRRREGLSPQQARGALIHDVKTELIMYASLPEWRHIFAMRCAKAADPEARRVMLPLREQFRAEYPEAFEDA